MTASTPSLLPKNNSPLSDSPFLPLFYNPVGDLYIIMNSFCFINAAKLQNVFELCCKT